MKKVKRKKKKKNGFRKFWKLGLEEFNTQNFDINLDGELIVREGNFQYNIYDIVKKYGTSTEIVFPTIIENRVRDLIDTFNAYIKILGYRGRFFYHYVMKVNQNKEFVLPLVTEGANLETGSANELKLVTEKAVVCDMCSSRPGGEPACVAECPHDAAMRVDAQNDFPRN